MKIQNGGFKANKRTPDGPMGNGKWELGKKILETLKIYLQNEFHKGSKSVHILTPVLKGTNYVLAEFQSLRKRTKAQDHGYFF